MKKKMDLEIKIIGEYLKKQLNLYQARGVSFEIEFEPDNTISLNEEITNHLCNNSGILPLFLMEIDQKYKEVTKDKIGMPFVYVRDDDAMVERIAEISENIDLSKTAILTKSLTFLDYIVEDRVKAAYVKKYGEAKAFEEFEKHSRVSVDLTDIYNNYERLSQNHELVVYAEPKSERVKNLTVQKTPSPTQQSNIK